MFWVLGSEVHKDLKGGLRCRVSGVRMQKTGERRQSTEDLGIQELRDLGKQNGPCDEGFGPKLTAEALSRVECGK